MLTFAQHGYKSKHLMAPLQMLKNVWLIKINDLRQMHILKVYLSNSAERDNGLRLPN